MNLAHSTDFYKRRMTLLGLIAILALIFWYSPTLRENFYVFVDYFEQLVGKNKILGSALFVTLAALSSILSPFSSVPLIPVAVAVLGSFASLVLLMTGWLIGGAVAFLIGKYASSLLSRKYFNKIEKIKENFSSRSQFGLVVLLKLALPTELTGYALGVARYSFPLYLLATFITELPFAAATVYLSDALIQKNVNLFASILIIAAIVVYLFYILIKRTSNADKTKHVL